MWTWVLQVLVAFVLMKVVHVVFWNIRRHFYVHGWILEFVLALAWSTALVFDAGSWWMVTLAGVTVGLIRGDQEEQQKVRVLR